ncbi:laccase-4-like [Nasonia vitripennis]|uniref:Uncharacterized protein n=1 Tax=Nasonia vitripennis TaxID=7425 RepID=A0A7M7IPV9_NASVI|nr:laccase-4-like [Nasonia vitripennis]
MSMPDLRLIAVLLVACGARLCTVDAASEPAEGSKNDHPDKIGLLPQSYGMGLPDDEVDWSRHPCRRQCRSDREPLTCRYGLTVERYISMSKACYDCPRNLTDCSRPHCIPGDGTEKMVIVANRKLPGLSIEVCKGDRLLMDVTNKLPTETTTIHWHGLHQRGTPFMDGVPYLTQCPIMPGEVFRYDFIADRPGSFIWHSHSGEQRADGLFGALIVRSPPEENPYAGVYNEDDKLMVINEWTHKTGSEVFVMQYQNGQGSLPSAILVNGLGRLSYSEAENMPLEVFQVEEGKRYRFRLANLGSQDCPIHVSIDDHPMLVISADGADIEPVEVDSIRILTGERYDFVLSADRPVDNYWIRFTGDIICRFLRTTQLAILRYRGAKIVEPKADPEDPNGSTEIRELNPYDKGTETPDAICIAHLNALEPDDISLTREPDHQFFITIDLQKLDNFDYHRKDLYGYWQVEGSKRSTSLQLNHISFKMPNFPPLTQPELIKPKQFCNYSTIIAIEKCKTEHCACTQTFQARLNSVVELVLIDPGAAKLNHPIHLHGYYYRVVAMEKVGDKLSIEEVKKMDQEGKIHRRLEAAPWKDSVIVPSGGYTIVRFHANNPGYWFLHCHFDEHASNGMALVIKVGEHEDLPNVPKNFPKCGTR